MKLRVCSDRLFVSSHGEGGRVGRVQQGGGAIGEGGGNSGVGRGGNGSVGGGGGCGKWGRGVGGQQWGCSSTIKNCPSHHKYKSPQFELKQG